MKLLYAFLPRFDCVTLLNGAFNERPSPVAYPAASPLYVTLLPLDAMLLPYTVKLLGGKAASNGLLASVVEASPERYVVSFSERHNYVYSPVLSPQPARNAPERLLVLVKSGDVASARRLMTDELARSVTDEAITGFFAPYSHIAENPFPDMPATHFLAPAEGGRADGFVFRMSGNNIPDIDEV